MEGSFEFLTTRLVKLAACAALVAALPLSSAYADEDEDILGYDAIIDQLNKENSRGAGVSRTKNSRASSASPFDDIWMHGGVGMSSIMQTISFDDGTKYELNQRGVQAALGIDLFSENWMAEGTARSFGESEEGTTRSSVQEFELKVMHKERFSRRLGYRAGLGLTGRYLTIKRAGIDPITYTTPSSVASAGVDFFLTDRFSLGADVNARTAMIGETLDRNSYDATVRFDAHF